MTATFDPYDHLPQIYQSALNELEQFIGELDGKTIAEPDGDDLFIDGGTVDAESAVVAFNDIVRAGVVSRELLDALESLTKDPPPTLDEPDTDAEVIIKMRAIARDAIEKARPH